MYEGTEESVEGGYLSGCGQRQPHAEPPRFSAAPPPLPARINLMHITKLETVQAWREWRRCGGVMEQPRHTHRSDGG